MRPLFLAAMCAWFLGGNPPPVLGQEKPPPTRTRTRSGPSEFTPAKPANFGWFRIEPPKEWRTIRPPGSVGMRNAEYALPAAEGDPEDGQCIVYYFGNSKTGSVEQNLKRWREQFTKPSGMSDQEHSKVYKRTIDGLKVTILEIRGIYLGRQTGATSIKSSI